MTADIPFAPLVGLGSIVFAFVNFLKFLTAKDWVPARTQGVTWLAGIVAMVLFAHSDFGNSITVAGHYLDNLNTGSLIILGLSASSLFTAFNQTLKAIDGHQTAATPQLKLGSEPVVQPQQAVAVLETLVPAIPHDTPPAEPRAPEQKTYTIPDSDMAAAQRAGWNPADGDPPYRHVPEPPDALVLADIPVTPAPAPTRMAAPGEKVEAKGRKRKAPPKSRLKKGGR